MALTLDPLPAGTDPWTKIIATLGTKIASTGLSFQKWLTSEAQGAVNIFDQTGQSTGTNIWEPSPDQRPAVVLLIEPHPGVDDHGAGDERWYVDVGVDFSMNLDKADARKGFAACYELVRTIFCGWRQGLAIDPLSALAEVADYQIVGEVMPRISEAGVGRFACRCFLTLRFTITDTILG